MHDPCDKSFLLVPCGALDLLPTSRSNLLPGGGPQFFEFACFASAIPTEYLQNAGFIMGRYMTKFRSPKNLHKPEDYLMDDYKNSHIKL